MVNIQDVWPTEDSVPAPGLPMAEEIVKLRLASHLGFVQREERRGLIRQGTSLSSSQGQEMVRIYLARATEEIVEALGAKSEEHKFEELIDSLNFLMCPAFLERTDTIWLDEYVRALTPWLQWAMPSSGPLNPEWVGYYIKDIYDFTEHLRNRAWMENAQSLVFEHQHHHLKSIGRGLGLILTRFDNLTQFWLYFKAKDNVLQFRLRSGY